VQGYTWLASPVVAARCERVSGGRLRVIYDDRPALRRQDRIHAWVTEPWMS
jgi:hypothetical protein